MGALRNLTISQQVGLLFLAWFGLLAIATLVGFGCSLPDTTGER